MSDISLSLQSWVSTIQSLVLTAGVLLYVARDIFRIAFYYCSSESWEREFFFFSLGQIPLSQLLQSPVYLAPAFTAYLSLSYYDTILGQHSMISAGFQTIPACSCSDDQASEG